MEGGIFGDLEKYQNPGRKWGCSTQGKMPSTSHTVWSFDDYKSQVISRTYYSFTMKILIVLRILHSISKNYITYLKTAHITKSRMFWKVCSSHSIIRSPSYTYKNITYFAKDEIDRPHGICKAQLTWLIMSSNSATMYILRQSLTWHGPLTNRFCSLKMLFLSAPQQNLLRKNLGLGNFSTIWKSKS